MEAEMLEIHAAGTLVSGPTCCGVTYSGVLLATGCICTDVTCVNCGRLQRLEVGGEATKINFVFYRPSRHRWFYDLHGDDRERLLEGFLFMAHVTEDRVHEARAPHIPFHSLKPWLDDLRKYFLLS